jgi:hypothetical protein
MGGIPMKSLKGAIFLVVWGSVLLMSVSYAQEEGENIVRNPSFEDGTAEWQLLITAPAAATWEVVEEGVVGDCVYIDVSAVSGTDWHVEIHQPNQMLDGGETYTFNFWVKTSEDVGSRPFGPGIEGLGASDWWETFNINDEWQEFSRTWEQGLSGSATIHYGLGQVKGDVWLDHVRLYIGEYVEENLEDIEVEKAVESKGKLATAWGSIKMAD